MSKGLFGPIDNLVREQRNNGLLPIEIVLSKRAIQELLGDIIPLLWLGPQTMYDPETHAVYEHTPTGDEIFQRQEKKLDAGECPITVLVTCGGMIPCSYDSAMDNGFSIVWHEEMAS